MQRIWFRRFMRRLGRPPYPRSKDAERFHSWLLGEGYSEKTAARYVGYIARIEDWLQSHGYGALRRAQRAELASFARTLPNAAGTRRAMRYAIRLFCICFGLDASLRESITLPKK